MMACYGIHCHLVIHWESMSPMTKTLNRRFSTSSRRTIQWSYGPWEEILRVSDEFGWQYLYRWVANYIRSWKECQRVKHPPSSSASLKPLPIPTDCWKSVSLGFMFGMLPDQKCRTGLVFIVNELSKMVHLAPYNTSIQATRHPSFLWIMCMNYAWFLSSLFRIGIRVPRQGFGVKCLSCLVASSTCLPPIISKMVAARIGQSCCGEGIAHHSNSQGMEKTLAARGVCYK